MIAFVFIQQKFKVFSNTVRQGCILRAFCRNVCGLGKETWICQRCIPKMDTRNLSFNYCPFPMILISPVLDFSIHGFDKPIHGCAANTHFTSHFFHGISGMPVNQIDESCLSLLTDRFWMSSILSFNMSFILSSSIGSNRFHIRVRRLHDNLKRGRLGEDVLGRRIAIAF